MTFCGADPILPLSLWMRRYCRVGRFASVATMTEWISHSVPLENQDTDSRKSRLLRGTRGRAEDANCFTIEHFKQKYKM